MKYISIALMLCFSFLSFTHVNAQEDTVRSVFDLSLEELLEARVTTATKTKVRSAEAPAVVSTFSRSELERYGWYSLQQMLTSLPSYAPSQDYDRQTLSGRGVFEGWNNNHLLLLVDGVQFNDNLYGSAYTSEITPLVFVQDVEVIRGPGSALYGSNAMNGVINLKPITPEDLNGKARLGFRAGSNGTLITDVLAATQAGGIDLVAAYNMFRTNGFSYESYDDSERFAASGNPLRFNIENERESQYFFFEAKGRERFKGLSFQYHEQHWRFGTGHGWLFQVPDLPENLREQRRLMALKYSNAHRSTPLQYQFLARYQNHGIDWNMRWYPNGAFDGFYPQGVSEYLNTNAEDLLLRAQLSYESDNWGNLLGGVEHDIFWYEGDKAHASNIDLNSTFEPFPNNETRTVGPWLEYIQGNLVHNLGVFAQYVSPGLFANRLRATLSLRYDNQFFNYQTPASLLEPGQAQDKKQKSFNQLSPRASLVYSPSRMFSLKLLASRAFRTPSPTEMFGANTYSLASNIDELKPELLTSFEAAAVLHPTKKLNVQINAYHNSFENIIAYSVANANLSTNLYSLTTFGVEADAKLVKLKGFSGFAGLGFVQRLDETIADENISEEPNTITWTPALVARLGLAYEAEKFGAALNTQYQGKTLRRSSDFDARTQDFRPESVAAWVSVDTRFFVKVTDNIRLNLLVENALNQERFLMKNFAYRFDYQMPGRSFLAGVQFDF